MTVDEAGLASFGRLATAIGLLGASGSANPDWFGDPIGASGVTGNQHGLRHLLADNEQREALVGFVDEILGPPEAAHSGGQTWVPLFTEDDPQLTIFAVVDDPEETSNGTVHLGVGLEYASGTSLPRVATRIHVPLFQFHRRGGPPLPPDGDVPGWLLLGRPEGRVGIGVDVTFTETRPAPGTPSLGGVALALGIPTSAGADLAVSLILRDLQLPGARAPRTFELDAESLEELGTDVFELLIGLVREQANALDPTDPALAPFAALTGLLGLRHVAGLPELALVDLPTHGVATLVGWVERVLSENTARDAWLGQLAMLVHGSVDAAADAVVWTAGPMRASIGIRVSPGTGGHPLLIPYLEVALATRDGVRARFAADLMRADTGTGTCTALPDARIEAVFGADAGVIGPDGRVSPGSALLASSGDAPSVGSLHTGVALDATGRLAFVLTLHNVVVLGRPHEILDLSSPSAALDAARDVVEGALVSAIERLGPAGVLINRLLGLDPPTDEVRAIDVTALLADPLAEITRYWRELTGIAEAGADVLGRLQSLLTGTPIAPARGRGTAAQPWRVALAGTDGASLQLWVWREADTLVVDLVGAVRTTVLTEYEVRAAVGLTVLRVDFLAPRAAFATEVRGRLALARADGTTARLRLSALAIEADEIGAEVTWAPAHGLRAGLVATGLAIGAPQLGVAAAPLTLPSWDAEGRLRLPASDWDAVERILAALLIELRAPAVTSLLDLVGWRGRGPHLSLGGLFGPDPAAAVGAWLADLVLDADRVRLALGPVAALLSGFRRSAPRGLGTSDRPLRCPVADDVGAPGLSVWLEPDSLPPLAPVRFSPLVGSEPPESATIVEVLREVGGTLQDVADLLIARESLAAGLDVVVRRWAGTDGLVGPPETPVPGVTAVVLDGRTYGELVALGSAGLLLDEVLETAPPAVVHIGCEATWATDRDPGTSFDLSAASATGPLPDPLRIAATGPGTWYARLPTVEAAGAARPDRSGVGDQAARLTALLAARTEPVVLVAYGACGAAAVRAAESVAQVTAVVTIGAPWSPPATMPAAGADTVLLLRRLGVTEEPMAPDSLIAVQATPRRQIDLLVRREVTDLPSAATERRREGLPVYAVFGQLDADTIGRGLGSYVAAGIQARQRPVAATTPTTAVNVGIDAPMARLDLGGLHVGIDTTLRMCRVTRAAGAVAVSTTRAVVIDVHIGVQDGWIVGGPTDPGAPGHLRWMSARVEVPQGDGPGSAELVLHEATALGVDRERWVVRAGTTEEATTAVPEVRVLLAEVAARLRSASPALSTLLDLLGLTRDGGLDPDGLDRLLHDTSATMHGRVAADPSAFAAALRAVVSGGGLAADSTATGSVVRWRLGASAPAEVNVAVDLASGTFDITLTVEQPGLPPIAVEVSTPDPATVSANVSLGAIDPDAGGVRLVARTSPEPSAVVEWAKPRGAVRTVALAPEPDPDGLIELVTVVLPAVTAHALATALRGLVPSSARPALDAALNAVGLLTAADELGGRDIVVPIGLFADPGGWLRYATEAFRDNAASSAVALLDALAPLVAPGRGTASGWPLADGVTVQYGVEAGNRLRLVLDVALRATMDSSVITTHLTGGLVIGPDGRPQPTVGAAVDIDGRGLQLLVSPTTEPAVQLSLVRGAPAGPLRLYPSGPGLGEALGAAVEMLLPMVLNAVAGHRNDSTASLARDVGQVIYELGVAMDLVEGREVEGARIEDGVFTATLVGEFAADPAAKLVTRLPFVITTAVASVARALDPAGTLVGVTRGSESVTLGFGHATPERPVSVVLDASGGVPAVELRANVEIGGVGRLRLDRLRLSTAGVDIAVRLGPIVLDVGSFALRPLLVLRVGSASGSDPRVGLGLALDDAAARSVEVRWALNDTVPVLTAVHRGPSGEREGTETEAAQWLLTLGLSLAGGVLVDHLRGIITGSMTRTLAGVVFLPGGTRIDPGLALDLFEPDAAQRLVRRLKRLLWNAAGESLSVTLDRTVAIGLVRHTPGGGLSTSVGLNVTLADDGRFTLADGDVRVELEVDASWVNPTLPPGLSIYVLAGRDSDNLVIEPSVSVVGLGVRFTKPTGPLLSLDGLSLDGIAVHLYGEANRTGVGGGINLELAGFAVSPGGAGGDNTVANGIMNDAGQTGPSSRPTFSPALAIQQHPGRDLSVSVRAGRPPGPWWLVIQRQLGPLYLERVGLDTAETDGTVSRIVLLFDGQVALFGLNAAVDQLSIGWDRSRGDVLNIGSWAVDLMGLAISADLSGATLAGGLLKTVDPNPIAGRPDVISYVGMLIGRFGTYGLSVFGGYTDDEGNPSFFIFGALNGPIGGPPAFFVTGVGGGLGINRRLVVPDDPARVAENTFIRGLDPNAPPIANPMERLRQLNAEFPVQRGNFWFAAGISFNCFSLVDGVAVLAVSFGDGLDINMLGLARMALPRPGAELVSIELALLVRFSTREGIFMIRAQLTENSWLLYRDVRLTGGFAFVVWWKGPLAGQFVLSIGGYHPDFYREGYPDVPRIGLVWQVSNAIVIKGGAYFALTSEALMAGLDVEVSLDFGFVWARIAFGAHGIIYFDPFFLSVLVYARISAGVRIDLGLSTISLSITLGASIRVSGPEFAGEATLEIGPCTLAVAFGGAQQVGDPQTWHEFVAKYLEDAGDGSARALSSIAGRGALPPRRVAIARHRLPMVRPSTPSRSSPSSS